MAWPDCSNCPWHVEGLFSCIPEALGLWAFLQMEKNCTSHADTHGQNRILPAKFPISTDCSQTIAAITNKTGCPWLPESWVSPALQLWGSVHSFQWKRIITPAKGPLAKFGIFLQNSLYTMVSPRQKLLGQTDLAGPWPWVVASTNFPADIGALCFPFYRKESSFLECSWLKLGFCPKNYMKLRIAPT